MNIGMINIDQVVAEGSDQTVLEIVTKLLDRVTLLTDYVQNEDGFIMGQYLKVRAGESEIHSQVSPMPYPMMPVPLPENTEVN